MSLCPLSTILACLTWDVTWVRLPRCFRPQAREQIPHAVTEHGEGNRIMVTRFEPFPPIFAKCQSVRQVHTSSLGYRKFRIQVSRDGETPPSTAPGTPSLVGDETGSRELLPPQSGVAESVRPPRPVHQRPAGGSERARVPRQTVRSSARESGQNSRHPSPPSDVPITAPSRSVTTASRRDTIKSLYLPAARWLSAQAHE